MKCFKPSRIVLDCCVNSKSPPKKTTISQMVGKQNKRKCEKNALFDYKFASLGRCLNNRIRVDKQRISVTWLMAPSRRAFLKIKQQQKQKMSLCTLA